MIPLVVFYDMMMSFFYPAHDVGGGGHDKQALWLSCSISKKHTGNKTNITNHKVISYKCVCINILNALENATLHNTCMRFGFKLKVNCGKMVQVVELHIASLYIIMV